MRAKKPSLIDLLLEEYTVYVEEDRVMPKPIGLTFEEIGNGKCRWPLENGLWCGAKIESPIYEGHRPVYCKGHAQIAYKTRTIRER